MKLFRIKNKYIYKPKDSISAKGSHIYAMYRGRKSKEVRAIRTTHIYEPKKVTAIEHGDLHVEKFKGVKYPSGVQNKYINKDVNGKSLDYRQINARRATKHSIPRRQAKRIKTFAKKPWK